MKFFSLPALLAAALFSVVVALPFLPSAKMRTSLFELEVRLSASGSGLLQAYYDDGGGLREELSVRIPIGASQAPDTYRLPLPPATYRLIRLDPPNQGVTTVLHSLRVVTRDGRVFADLPLSSVQPVQQVESVTVRSNGLEIKTAAKSDDPQLHVSLPQPLVVRTSLGIDVRNALPVVLPVFVALAALLLLCDRVPRGREELAARVTALALHPVRLVALVAALAVIASAYPVIFLGKSYVSPNLGTILLYENFPTLPGYKSTETTDVKGSDIGAVMWSHIPLSMMQHRALAQGELPLWNRYNSAGTPLLAQGQSMFGDPLHFLVVAANGAAWAWDLKYLIAKWLFAVGLGLLVLAVAGDKATQEPEGQRTTAGSPLVPALLVATAAPFLGFFFYRLNHPAFFSVCYAPWALFAWVRVTQAVSRREIAAWAGLLVFANLALMNSGTAKEAYMLLLSMNFSGMCVLVASDSPWRLRLGKLAALGWAGVIFVLLTAPIWATFLNTLKNSYTAYNAVSAFQIQPGVMLGAFDEIFYRPIMTEQRTFNPSVNFVILAGLLYFLATLRHNFANRAATAIAASAVVPLALAFGLVPAAWVVQLPFLSNIAHLDNTFTCVLLVLWSVLAGVGFAQAARRLGTPDGRGDLAVAALLLFALVFSWIAFRQAVHRQIFGAGSAFSPLAPGQVLPVSSFVWGHLAALLGAMVLVGWAARRALGRRALTPALTLMLALGALVMLWRTGLHARSVGFENYVARPTVRANFHAKSPAVEWVRAAQKSEPGRAFGLRGNLFPGWTGVYGLESVHGPDALVNPWLRELVGASGVERLWDWRIYVEPANVAAAQPFLDLLNVRWYLDLASDQGVLGRALQLLKTGDLDVYGSPTAWPRAFFSSRLDVYDQPADLVAKIKTAAGRPFASAQRGDVTTQPSFAGAPRGFDDRTIVPAKNYHLTENTTSFDVRTDGPGVIVLTETWWPGDFRAEINGQRVPIVRINHAFKGVVVPAAGDCHVVFRYVPKNWPRNLALCAAGALGLALSLYVALRPARTP